MAEQNRPITFASFGIVSLIFGEGSRGVFSLEEITRVFVFVGQIKGNSI